MVIDTHAHLTDEIYNGAEDIIASLKDNNISHVFCVAYNKESIIKTLQLCAKHDNLYAIVGVHPSDIFDFDQETKNIIKANLSKVIAIGEIGLDYHYTDNPSRQDQIRGFVEQLKFADSLNLPIVIHNRDSAEDMLQTLKANKKYINNGGIFHCFSEDYEFFKQIKKLGLKISVGGSLTFKNNQRLQQTIAQIDLNDIVVETDCPYLTPVPYRGKLNEPKYVNLVVSYLANLKGVSIQTVEDITTKNAKQIFRIK